MTKTAGLGDQFYFSGNDLGGDIQQLSRIYGGPAALDSTDITQRGMSRFGGLRDGGFEATAFFDPAVGASHAVLSALPTADVLGTYHHVNSAAGTPAIGDPAASCIAKQIDYGANRSQDGQLLFQFPVMANGFGLEWGFLATPGKLTQGGAGNGASLNLGSAGPGAFGLQAYLHVFAFTGTSITVKLQSSSDNGAGDAFADIAGATFLAASAAGTWQRIAVAAATIEQYIRIVSTGTFSNAVFLVQVCRNPVAVAF